MARGYGEWDEEMDPLLGQALTRLMLLTEVGSVLSSSLDGSILLKRLARLLVPRLADWCAVYLRDERVHRVALVHRDSSLTLPPAPEAGFPPPVPLSDSPIERALLGGAPILLDRLPRWNGPPTPLGQAHEELIRSLGAHTAIIAPMRTRRRVLGAIALARTDPDRPLNSDDVSLVDDLAHRAALAIDNARSHDAQRVTARDLQLSLLPRLPRIDRAELACRYTAAPTTAEVGGDWYDAFPLPDGATALSVGDISGHDLTAALRMSQVRNMLRALAWDRQAPPGETMERLDALLDGVSDAETATAVYGRVEGGNGGPWSWYWTNAGHPPPLLVTADGDTRYLTDGHGTLLGTGFGARRPNAREELPPWSTLVLYTDGLVEHRGEPLQRGLVRLRRSVTAMARENVDTLCESVIDSMPGAPADDVAVLALRVPHAGRETP